MGFIREVDKVLSKSLMVEFFRLQTIITDDLNGALQTWQAKMTTATDRLLRDLDAATQRDAALPSQNAAVGVALHQFQTAARMRLALPQSWLEEARDEMERFIRFHLEELRSQQEMKKLIVELSCRVADHRGQVREILHGENLRHPEVARLVLVGLAADRPLESNFFLGLLEGLLGSLGIAAPGEGNPPTSSHEGVSRAWSTAVRQALLGLGEEKSEMPGAARLPPDLNLHHEDVFLEQQKHLTPPIFSDPLFIPTVAKAVFEVVQPPVLLKALPTAHGRKTLSTPPQPEDAGLEPKAPKPEEPALSTSPPPEQVQEETSETLDIESDEAAESFPEEEQSRGSLKVKLPLQKRGHTTTPSSSRDGATPSKVQKGTEAKEAKTSPPCRTFRGSALANSI